MRHLCQWPNFSRYCSHQVLCKWKLPRGWIQQQRMHRETGSFKKICFMSFQRGTNARRIKRARWKLKSRRILQKGKLTSRSLARQLPKWNQEKSRGKNCFPELRVSPSHSTGRLGPIWSTRSRNLNNKTVTFEISRCQGPRPKSAFSELLLWFLLWNLLL